jgi:hypothetical protein
VKWLCLDFDGKGHSYALVNPLAAAVEAANTACKLDAPMYIERSGRGHGYHGWIFFEEPVEAALAMELGRLIAPKAAPLVDGGVADPLKGRGIEVFPKQVRIAENGYGNLVWLPFYGRGENGGNQFYRTSADGGVEQYLPRSFETLSRVTLTKIVEAARAACAEASRKAKGHQDEAPSARAPKKSSAKNPQWDTWRKQALAALPLEKVYGQYLTGIQPSPGWLQCRDPGSPTGDQNPSASVADVGAPVERGSFHSFRESRTISVFDFLIEYGGAVDFLEAAKMVADLSGVPLPQKAGKLTARDWFKQWIERNRVTYSFLTEGLSFAGQEMPLEAARSKAALDASETEGPADEKLKHVFVEWLHQQRETVKEAHRNRLAYSTKTGDTELRRLLRALTGKERDLDLAVLKHFIWQVKRKLNGLRVEHHLMPILFGKTGGGKSRAIEKLLEPVLDLVDFAADLAFLNDERQLFRLTRAFVVFIDEMAHADKVSIDALKNRITSPTINWRALGFNARAGGTNTATFIGASNNHVRDLIYDPTSMRRFHEIGCLDKLDWETINRIDYLAIWQSVDHNAECPVVPVLADLAAAQEELRAKDLVEEWVEERVAVSKKSAFRGSAADEYVSAQSLYRNFKEYWDSQGKKSWSMKRFSTRLTELVEEWVGCEGSGWKKSNGKKFALRVKPEEGVKDDEEEFFFSRRGKK